MTTRKNRPLILTMALAFALITVLSGTFAWFTTHDSVTNHLETGSLTNGDAKIVEVFDEDEPLNPGTSVDKFVGVVNTGSTDAFVRISFAEALQKLSSATPAAAASKFSGAAGKIPQLFDEKAIAAGGAYASWTVLAAGDAEFEAASVTSFLAATSGVTVRYQKTSANGKDFYRFVAYAPLSGLTGANEKYNGQYQLVDLDVAISATKQLSVNGTVGYMEFTQAAKTNAKWAAITNHTAFAGYDFTGGAKDITTLPDAVSRLDAMLSLTFSANVKSNIASCSAGDWWYCKDDGYFYYIGKLASGAQTTNWLLEAVALDEAADNSYCNLNYDLTPCMDAIQAVEDALTSTSGWNLDATDYAALITLLTA